MYLIHTVHLLILFKTPKIACCRTNTLKLATDTTFTQRIYNNDDNQLKKTHPKRSSYQKTKSIVSDDTHGINSSDVKKPVKIKLENIDKYKVKRPSKTFDRRSNQIQKLFNFRKKNHRTWVSRKNSRERVNQHSRIMIPSPWVTKLIDIEKIFDRENFHNSKKETLKNKH